MAEQTSLEDLLDAYGKGDAPAFRELFERTKPLVYGYLRRRLSEQGAADDVFQDTYLRVHKYITSFDRSGNAIAWLLRIARGCANDYLRKRTRGQEADHAVAATAPLSKWSLAEDGIILRQILSSAASQIKPEDVELIVARFVHDDSYEEIASQRSLTPASARQRLSRALRKLRAGSAD